MITESTIRETIKSGLPLFYACERCRTMVKGKKLATAQVMIDSSEIVQLKANNKEMAKTIKDLQSQIDAFQITHDPSDLQTVKIASLEREVEHLKSNRRRRTEAEKDAESLEISTQIGKIVAEQLAKELKPINDAISKLSSKTSDVIEVVSDQPTASTPAIQQPTARSVSRARTPSVVPKSTVALKKLTFAEIIANNAVQRGAIRNIKINNPEDVTTMREIQRDELAKSIKIAKCSTRGPDFITITCADNDEAQKLDEALAIKYQDRINVSEAGQQRLKFKVTNLPEDVDEEQIIEELRQYNYWLNDAEMSIERFYTVNTGKRSYANVIIMTDVKTLKLVLQKGSITYGFRERYVFEVVNTIQCSCCWQFGHTASGCTSKVRCKRCGDDHHHSDCRSEVIKCINCINNNKKQSKTVTYNIHHIASSDLCRVKDERILGLKTFYSQNKKN